MKIVTGKQCEQDIAIKSEDTKPGQVYRLIRAYVSKAKEWEGKLFISCSTGPARKPTGMVCLEDGVKFSYSASGCIWKVVEGHFCITKESS